MLSPDPSAFEFFFTFFLTTFARFESGAPAPAPPALFSSSLLFITPAADGSIALTTATPCTVDATILGHSFSSA